MLPRLLLVLLHILFLLPYSFSSQHHLRDDSHSRRYGGRRALHEPLFPLDSAPALPPPPPAPFFPFLPDAAPPQPAETIPAPAAVSGDAGAGGDPSSSSSSLPDPTAPANMSALALPVSRASPLRSFLSSHRLLTLLLLVATVASALLAAALLYLLTRHRRDRPEPDPVVYKKPALPSPAKQPALHDEDQLHGRGSAATVSSTSSPELRPMPPLPRQFQQTQMMSPLSSPGPVLGDRTGDKRAPQGVPAPPPPPPPMPPGKGNGSAQAAPAPPAPPPLLPRAGNGSGWLPRRLSERPAPTVIRASAGAVHPEESPQSEEKDADTGATALTKLKPLHWDKFRASSGRPTVWDQLKASSFR